MSPTTRSMKTGEENTVKVRPQVSKRAVKDPIHDLIQFDQRVWSFIDTQHFQRLRSIKQLGVSYYVWPGASHNRFEHCIGVAYFARLMAEHLQKSQPELNISDRDVHCVELAGLCHDLGHGPWSHVWDSLFIPTALKGKKWKHEDASEMMFDDLIEKNNIDISEQDANFVKALIAGDRDRCDPPEKYFLFEIVANKRNGIDVDKFDYIMRDGHAIGDKGNMSLSKLIQSARVIENQICYDIKDANQIYELCYTRFSLHKRIYNHKTAKAIEYMVIDALLAAEPHMKIAEQVDKPEKYVFLTDDIMPRIEMSSDPELAGAQAIFRRIRTRDLYRCVDYKISPWEFKDICKERITPKTIVAAAKSLSNNASLPSAPGTSTDDDFMEERDEPSDEDITMHNVDLQDELSEEHVIVDMAPMHYGMQEKNPMHSVKFYSKTNPDTCASAGLGDMSTLMPASFGEVMLRVYTRDRRFFSIIQAGYRAVLKTMPSSIPPETSTTTLVLTPPATEAPSTPPRKFSRTTSLEQFSDNTFTTAREPWDSPTQRKKPASKAGKRERIVSGEPGSPPSKRMKGSGPLGK